jgi:DME family drug/metabolite transporter
MAGVLFALGSGFGYAVLALCSRALAGRYHPLQPISVGFAVGAVLLLPFALATGFVATYPLAGWGLLLYLGLVPTAFAYWLFLQGMKHTTATTASILTLLEPLTSAALAAALFGERLGPLGFAGAALLLGAMAILLRR